MTRRITVSLPDDVASFAERAGNTSALVADVLRRRMRTEDLRARWAALGYDVTDADLERTRSRLAGLQPISDGQHTTNLAWLAQFDSDAPTA